VKKSAALDFTIHVAFEALPRGAMAVEAEASVERKTVEVVRSVREVRAQLAERRS